MRFPLVIAAAVLFVTGCSGPDSSPSASAVPSAATGSPGSAAAERPDAMAADRSTTSPTAPSPPVAPAGAGVAGPGEHLIFQHGDAVHRLSLRDPNGQSEKLFGAGLQAVADPRGRYVAAISAGEVKVFSLNTRQQVVAVPGADSVAFRSDDTAVVAQPSRPEAFEGDCHRPTSLREVSLRDGSQREIYRSQDGVRPFAATASKVVMTVSDRDSCETASVHLLDVATGRTTRLTTNGTVNAVDQDITRILVQHPRDDQHPHGYNTLFDDQGKRRATLPYYAEAAYSVQQDLLYNEVVFDKDGFTADSRIHLGAQDLKADVSFSP